MAKKGRPASSRCAIKDVVRFVQISQCSLEGLYKCSPRAEHSYISMLCVFCGLKNTFINRFKIYTLLKRKSTNITEMLRKSVTSTSNESESLKGLRETTPPAENAKCEPLKGLREKTPPVENAELPSEHVSLRCSNENAVLMDVDSNKTVTHVEVKQKFTFLLKSERGQFENDKDIFCTSEVRHRTSKNLLLQHSISCVVVFKGHRMNKRRRNGLHSFVEYARCKHPNCRFYKFQWNFEVSSAILQIYYKGPKSINHFGQQAYPLRGSERTEVKNTLKTTMPNVLRQTEIESVNDEMALEGNWQGLRSLAVYQKARSESISEEDRHKDPLLDIVVRYIEQEKGEEYIQLPNGRTLIYMYSRHQVSSLVPRCKQVTAYFDATGSVVRRSTYDHKRRILYYALIINSGGSVIPIAELISSMHDSATITTFLINFKHFVRTSCRRTWPLFDMVVTDWSSALMTSVCQGFNEMTLYTYLKVCYKYITNREHYSMPSVVVLKLCCAHFIKMICNRLSKAGKTGTGRKVIVDAVGVLLQCTSLEELTFQFENVVILLLSPTLDNKTKVAIKELTSTTCDISEDILSQRKEYNEYYEDEDSVRGEYTTSPFFVHFFKVYDKIDSSVNRSASKSDGKANPHYSESFCVYLLHKVMPFAPLWSNILDKGSLSNANVETWFKTVKKEILRGQSNVKAGRFVNLLNKRVLTDLKAVDLQIGKKPKISTSCKEKIHGNIKDVDNPHAVEGWEKRKRTKGYLYRRHLTKLKEKLKSETDESKSVVKLLDDGDGIETKPENKSTITEESRGSNALENGLLLNNEFYMSAAFIDKFIVGRYSYLGITINLSSADYKTLVSTNNHCEKPLNKSERWVADYCIDAMSFVTLRNFPDIYYIDTISTYLMLEGQVKNYTKFVPFVKSFHEVNYIIMPYLMNQNHWLLIVLDMEEHIIYIINPSDSCLIEEAVVYNKIKRYFVARDRLHDSEKLNIRKWKTCSISKVPKQKSDDIINCGVYVMYYITAFAKCKSMKNFDLTSNIQSFDPEEFRCTVQNVLLITSDVVYDKCLICGTHDDRAYIQCYCCQRWLHITSCSGLSDETLPNIDKPEYSYTCNLCIKHNSDPFRYKRNVRIIHFADLELEFFVGHYIRFLKNIFETRHFNEESSRFMSTTDPHKHLKWDYSTAFINIDTAVKVCKLIIDMTNLTDKEYVVYVLLVALNVKLISRYFGLDDNQINLFELYQQKYGNEEDMPNDFTDRYTLNMVYDAL